MSPFEYISDVEPGWPSRAAFFVSANLSQATGVDGNEQTHTTLEGRLAGIIAPRLILMGYELVRVAVLGQRRLTVQVMADRADGSNITVEDCEAISHDVSAALDVEDPIPGTWTLEVSSAGIDRPLTRVKDWNRYAGHTARVETMMPQLDGRKRFAGIVMGADDETAKLRLDDGQQVELRHSDIRRAKLVLTDALIAATASNQKPH
jgi:ribosome maturation factor RimP